MTKEDAAAATKCDTTGATQATLNFDNCVSGDVLEFYGTAYDWNSIMHYGLSEYFINYYKYYILYHLSILSFLLEGETGLVMQPKDASITSAGGNVLSEIDKAKLQHAYGCTACGGSQFSATGGSFKAESNVPTNYCNWALASTNGKQIILAFTVSI